MANAVPEVYTANVGQTIYAGSFAPAPPPPPAPTGAYRTTAELLFLDVDVGTPLASGGSYYETPARATVGSPKLGYNWGVHGPTSTRVDSFTEWAWANPGTGDWINQAGTPQATTQPHFTFTANAQSAGSRTYTADATAGAVASQVQNRYNAYIVRLTGAGARSIATRHHATLPAPSMQVNYTDGTSETLACTACVRMNTSGTAYSAVGAPEASASGVSIALEFRRPNKNKVVDTATVSITVSSHTSSPATFNGYLANPPLTPVVKVKGIANNYVYDIGLGAHPSVLMSHRYQDGSVYTDWVITSPSTVNPVYANWDPDVYGFGPEDLTKMPTMYQGVPLAGKWTQGNPPTHGGGVTLVNSSYTGENFVPFLPGHGALRVKVGKATQADGGVVGYSGSLGSDLRLYFPKGVAGNVHDSYTRFYFRYHDTRKKLADTKMFRSGSTTTATYEYPQGKFGVGVHHLTSDGGNGNVGGSNLGWSNRMIRQHIPMDAPGAYFTPGVHSWDMLGRNLMSGKDGGMGATLYPDTNYLIEVRCKLNTWELLPGQATGGSTTTLVDATKNWTPGQFVGRRVKITDGAGVGQWPTITANTSNTLTFAAQAVAIDATSAYTIGCPSDGIMQVWIDEVLVATHTNWSYRDGPLDYVNDTPFGTNRLLPFGEMGALGVWFNTFGGGIKPADEDTYFFYGLIACATQYIGAASTVASLTLTGANTTMGHLSSAAPMAAPSWAPAAGEIKSINLNTRNDIDPKNDPLANPNYPNTPPWDVIGGTGWQHARDYCGAVYCKDLGPLGTYFEYDASGHSANGATSGSGFDINTRTWARKTPRPLPVNNLQGYVSGSNPDPSLFDHSAGHWIGDSPLIPEAFRQPGYNPNAGSHTRNNWFYRPAAKAGNGTGEVWICWGVTGVGSGTTARGGHVIDLDTGLQRTHANLRPATGSACGGMVYFEDLDCGIGFNHGSSANTSSVDYIDCVTGLWTRRTATNSILLIPDSTVFRWGNYLVVCINENTPNPAPMRFYALDVVTMLVSPTSWFELTISAVSYPVSEFSSYGGLGKSWTVNWAYCPVNGCFYATNRSHGSNKVWKLTPPGAVNGTWVITEETMTGTLSARSHNGTPSASFDYNRLQWIQTNWPGCPGFFGWVEDYMSGVFQVIRPIGT